ncbi:MAG: hypothetical protein KGK18_03485 [Burkholderiales bacterium]|nr:hypothetical protein [Burkholderiales bacterium]
MIAANAHGLLHVWEAQRCAHPVVRALHVLAAARPERGWSDWLHAPIGERDAALLNLHESLFGAELHTTAACPCCGDRLESEFEVADVRCESAAQPPAPRGVWLQLQLQGYAVDYRLPNSDDLLQVTAQRGDAQDAALRLMRRCVSRARLGGDEIDAAALPEAVAASLSAEMARQDPDAELRITLVCPACGASAQTHFDIVTYFWSEFDDWAQRVLADVHVLARAYGWSEDAVLALSPARRQIYLDMVGA